ncbi:MAG: stalk domain-containing protein [Desulfurispora sp.]|uniref:stalk domain-containing protein n=1 Tax=Desulfurispora sp. TaxID=3014275 RepID=UPI004048F466
MNKRLAVVALTVLVLVMLSGVALASPADQQIPVVKFAGQEMKFDVPPMIENDRTLVPLRAIFEALGAKVDWEEATQTVTATKDDVVIKLTIGSNKASKNGQEVVLDVPAKKVNNRTLVPLRFVSEALGAKVGWDAATFTVSIDPPVAAGQPATPAEQPAAPAAEEKPVAQTPFEEYLNTLPYNADVIKDADVKAQFILNGEQGGKYVVHICKGKITWTRGESKDVAATVITTAQIWLDAASRKIDPTSAIMEGKIVLTPEDALGVFVGIADAFITPRK